MDCKICDAKNISPSYGGVDVCSACDSMGFCKRCSLLQAENKKLKELLEKIPIKIIPLIIVDIWNYVKTLLASVIV